MSRRHAGIPKSDKRRLGQYLPLNSTTAPGAFYAPVGTAMTPRQVSATATSQVHKEETVESAASASDRSDEEISEDYFDGSEFDDSEVADGQGDAPSDALDVTDQTWKVGQPKTQPLAYWVPNDAAGGKNWKTINFMVDFNKPQEVQKAVKARRLSIWRARTRHRLPMARQSTIGRKYTQVNSGWIKQEHVTYAQSNHGGRIHMRELARRYNIRFHGEDRTVASLSAHINRVDALRMARARYPA